MKLRTRHNSIRLRLTKSEVERFAQTGKVEETLDFGPGAGGQLVYELVAGGVDYVKAATTAGRISIFVPSEIAEDWTKSERVGIFGEQAVGGRRNLTILIEKDFTCLEPRMGDDDSDTFDHPGGVLCAADG